MGFDSRAGLGNITYDEGYQVARERVIDRGLLDKFDPRINDNWSTYAGSQLKFDLTDVIERSKKKLDTESTDSELAQQVVDPSTEVVEEAVVEEVKNTVSEGIDEIKTRRERARDNKGRFVADDPDTEKNEAYKD